MFLINKFLTTKPEIAILHTFRKPPWGGGNQFLLALKAAFETKGFKVTSTINSKTRMCIFNSFTFDSDLLKNHNNRVIMVHRIDGPTILIRGKDQDLDDRIFHENQKFASISVFQSFWSLQETIKLGYKPIRPVVITNAVDPKIFNSGGKKPFSMKNKVKLIASSWSKNVRKGFDFLKFLDSHLNLNKYTFTFVGNTPYRFKNIKVINPLTSLKLAKILKEHDIYIMASKHEACSNALIEALSCGLPALFYNGSSNPESVGYGGLGFADDHEALLQLDKLTQNYQTYQRLITVNHINTIADKYLDLLKLKIH